MVRWLGDSGGSVASLGGWLVGRWVGRSVGGSVGSVGSVGSTHPVGRLVGRWLVVCFGFARSGFVVVCESTLFPQGVWGGRGIGVEKSIHNNTGPM